MKTKILSRTTSLGLCRQIGGLRAGTGLLFLISAMILGRAERSPVDVDLRSGVAAGVEEPSVAGERADAAVTVDALIEVDRSAARPLGAAHGGARFVVLNPRVRSAGWVDLTVAPGLTYRAVRDRMHEHGGGDFVWEGRILGNPFSRVVLASRQGALAGLVDLSWQDGNEVYAIEPQPGGTSVLALHDGSPGVGGCEPVATTDGLLSTGGRTGGMSGPPRRAVGLSSAPLATAADPAVVEVMVVYTPASRALYGQSGLEAKILQAIADANAAYQNSQVFITAHLVHMAEVNYVETGVMADTLNRLRVPDDGYMDEVHAWRDSYGADLVVLIDEDTSDCGKGYLMSAVGTQFAAYGFSVVNSGCMSAYTLAHEMAHNMGSQHDRANATGDPAFPYSYGFVHCVADGTGYRTIMSYPCGSVPRLNYFSNPNVVVNGTPAGMAYEVDPAHAADNARSLNNTAHVVAGFRVGPQMPPEAPIGLAAVPAGPTCITLGWIDRAVNETGYSVERSSNNQDWALVATLPADAAVFTDGDLTLGITCFYRVRAYNSYGYSDYSNVSSAAPAEVPPAAPGNLQATALSGNQIDLVWADNSPNETAFVLERCVAGGTWATLVSLTANATHHQDLACSPGTTYSYRVRAVNGTGVSAYSTVASATTGASVTATLTVTSIGSEDGFILESDEASNQGGTLTAAYVATAALRAGDNYQDREYRSVLSFDTSAIPDEATVTAACVRLKRSNVSGTDPSATHSTCWIDLKGGAGFSGSSAISVEDFQAPADVNRAGVLVNPALDGAWSTGGLSTGALPYINRTGRTQVRVYFGLDDNDDAGADYLGWYSGENSVADNRPQLVIEYQLGPVAPPAAPVSLTATAVTEGQIDLAWLDRAGNESGFRVERSPDGAVWTELVAVGSDVTQVSDAGLTGSTTYYYRVQACGVGGNSAFSNVAGAVTLGSAGGSVTCASVAAEDGYIAESSETSTQGGVVTAALDSSTALRVGDDASKRQLRVFLSFDTSPIPDDATVVSAVLRMKRGGLSGTTPFQTHGTCWVDIKGGSGFGGAAALVAGDFQAAADVAQVASLSAAASNGTWSEGTLGTTGLPYVNRTGRTQFRVSFALDDNNDKRADYIGYYSGESSTAGTRPELVVTYSTPPIPVPAAPISLAGTAASPSRIDLAWQDTSGNETAFQVERSSGNGVWSQIAVLPAGTAAYSDSGLVAATSYAYRVRAANGGALSGWSNVAAIATLASDQSAASARSRSLVQGAASALSAERLTP